MLRRRNGHDEDDLSDADWGVYLALRRKAEPIRRPHTVINTSTDFSGLIGVLVERMQEEDA